MGKCPLIRGLELAIPPQQDASTHEDNQPPVPGAMTHPAQGAHIGAPCKSSLTSVLNWYLFIFLGR